MATSKDYIENLEGAERRYTTHKVKPVTRMVGEGENAQEKTLIRGIAAKINEEANLGWFREKIAPGAFDEVLAAADLDCRCLFNHDANLILARRNATTDTLKLMLDEQGHLAYEYETPNRSYALDLADAINSGDVDQSSFAFRIDKDSWTYDDDNPNNDLRTIEKVAELLDVSPVTYPAYQNTTVQVSERSHQAARKEALAQRQAPKGSNASVFDARHKFNKHKSKFI